ncbi:IS5 family transposase [Streptomyces sp. NPDC004728]|uniref:IS5 family transposase n=1 Tax=Streptomyces sp. NPDC004728 TaxID=3154289 RepID=UPI0033A45276
MGRGDLTNAEWDRLESFLPRGGGRGGRWSDHRRVMNGVLCRVRTGVRWRDLPEWFGPWETVCKRHRRWSADGTWKMLLSRIQSAEDAAGRIDRDVSVDSNAVRAHQHAAGARKAPAQAGVDRTFLCRHGDLLVLVHVAEREPGAQDQAGGSPTTSS